MSKEGFEYLLECLRRMPDVVNAFSSERVQARAFQLLIAEIQGGRDADSGNHQRDGHFSAEAAIQREKTELTPALPTSSVLSPTAARPYSMEISRSNKGLFVFLVDQSYAMQEPAGEGQGRKMDVLADMMNNWLQNMAIRASGSEGVKDWFDVAVLGYRTDREAQVIIESALRGELSGRQVASIAEIAEHPLRLAKKTMSFLDEDTGELIETPIEQPVWVEAVAEGGRPACHAFHQVHELLNEWIGKHVRSFPPLVFHLCGGECQDGDPVPYADAVRDLATNDGGVLLFNCYLASGQEAQLFPASEATMADEVSRTLFRMSSPMPEFLFESAVAEGFVVEKQSRCVAVNCDLVHVVKFLDMGSRVARIR